jgi:hypothetical protein
MKELSTAGKSTQPNKSTQAKTLLTALKAAPRSQHNLQKAAVAEALAHFPPHSMRPRLRGQRQRWCFARRIINSWSAEAMKQIAQKQQQEESRSRQIQLKIEKKLTVAYGFCADPSLTAFQHTIKV